jgi:hypothetical protein
MRRRAENPRGIRALGALAAALAALAPAAAGDGAPGGGRVAFVVGKVLTMDAADRVVNNAVVLVRDGRIEAVGKAAELAVPEGYQRIERPELWLVPGLVDCHNHTAGGGLSDLNDMVYLSNPGLRTLECINPENDLVKLALAGGVTTVLYIPGSGTNMSGFGTITKLAGKTVDEMVVKAPGSLKIAQAGNPERYWYGVDRSFMNYNTRQTLKKAQRYHETWKRYEQGIARRAAGAAAAAEAGAGVAVAANAAAETGEVGASEASGAAEEKPPERPAYDPIFDGFRPLFERQTIVSVHTQMYQVVMMTVLMLAKEFKLRTVLDHCTFDGWKTAPIVLSDPSIYAINGPRQFHFDRAERRMQGNAARWWQGGMRKLGINTDAPVIPQEQLAFQAAMACWYGWMPYEALRGLTRVPSEALMLDDRIGTIEAGKEAEFGLWTGNPIDPRSSCEMTVVRGRIVYDARETRRF